MILTATTQQDYHLPTAPHWAGGIGLPKAAAKSRHVQALRLFLCLICPVMGDRAGRAERLAGAAPVDQSPFGRSPDWSLAERLKTACGDTIMNTKTAPVVRVENTDIPVTVYQNARVITTELMAQLYGTAVNNIQENFRNNKDRFEEGKHYFKLEGEALREFKKSLTQNNWVSRQTRNLILWTERGASRHAKMLDTNQAWDVFDKLEDAYFEPPKEEKPNALATIGALPHEVESAIERRAHTLSLRQYDKIKEQLREAIQKWGKDLEGKKLVEFIQHIDLPDSKLVIVHRDTVWQLTSCLAYLDIAQKKALSSINALENETGMSWYGRD